MDAYLWTVLDASGAAIRTVGEFAGQEEAEAWMAQHWEELVAGGGTEVELRRGVEVVYRMGLSEG